MGKKELIEAIEKLDREQLLYLTKLLEDLNKLKKEAIEHGKKEKLCERHGSTST